MIFFLEALRKWLSLSLGPPEVQINDLIFRSFEELTSLSLGRPELQIKQRVLLLRFLRLPKTS